MSSSASWNECVAAEYALTYASRNEFLDSLIGLPVDEAKARLYRYRLAADIKEIEVREADWAYVTTRDYRYGRVILYKRRSHEKMEEIISYIRVG